MNTPDLPEIPGVEFRPIHGWPGYAASGDGSIWELLDDQWVLMQPRHLVTGPRSVWLRNRGGNVAFSINELLQRAFGVDAGVAFTPAGVSGIDDVLSV